VPLLVQGEARGKPRRMPPWLVPSPSRAARDGGTRHRLAASAAPGAGLSGQLGLCAGAGLGQRGSGAPPGLSLLYLPASCPMVVGSAGLEGVCAFTRRRDVSTPVFSPLERSPWLMGAVFRLQV